MLGRVVAAVVFTVAVAAAASAQDVKRPEIDFGRYHALVIGNNDSQHLRNLTRAVGRTETLESLQQKLKSARNREAATKQQLKTGLLKEQALRERNRAAAE